MSSNIIKNNLSLEYPAPIIKQELMTIDCSTEDYGQYKLSNYETTFIDFPIFTKNKKIEYNKSIRYLFDEEKDRWLQINPSLNSKIPGEFEERIFFAIMMLYRENNFAETIYTDFYALIKNMKIKPGGSIYEASREGLKTLARTKYEFNNCFYNSKSKIIENDYILTTLFSIRIIDLENIELIKDKYKPFFTNPKVKSLIEINFSKQIYNEMIKEDFLMFDINKFLELEDVIARDLWIKLTKWRAQKRTITLPSKYLANKIPLSFENTNIPKTIQRLEKAFEYLKSQKMVKKYELFKDSTFEKSFFTIHFYNNKN